MLNFKEIYFFAQSHTFKVAMYMKYLSAIRSFSLQLNPQIHVHLAQTFI